MAKASFRIRLGNVLRLPRVLCFFGSRSRGLMTLGEFGPGRVDRC